MNDTPATSAPAAQPGTGSSLKPEVIAIIAVGVAIITAVVAIGALLLTTADQIQARLDSAITQSATELRAFRAEAAADRRALQSSMDELRGHMQRLGDRQARLEGERQGSAAQ
ncbi:MAG: hypothetical protein OXC28_18750 [Defluviicoccus sp.]|nr:hypothetical protein [Defluviicoccus sp.]